METALKETVSFITSKTKSVPDIAVVLGSGLGDFAQELVQPAVISTSAIPHYPVSAVQGHAGKILFGAIHNNGRTSKNLMVFQGRVHFYECDDIQKVVYPIRTAAELGVKTLVVTNAAGGINRQFESGTLMFIKDYINLTGEDPQKGDHKYLSGQKKLHEPSLSVELLRRAKDIAVQNKIAVKEGVYCWTKGPSYETASEIRMMQSIGADAVGMSTVPEIMTAASYGINVLGISCITNMATGISPTKLSHDEVTETANRVKADFTKLVREIILSFS